MKSLHRLWADEAGFVVSAELVLVGTILVLGLIVGLTEVRNQVVQELADLAIAVGSVNQSYSYSGIQGHNVDTFTAGSLFVDTTDFCDNGGIDPVGAPAGCINVEVPPTREAAQ